MHIHGGNGKEWLPRLDNELAVLHPFCGECGIIKNITNDRARKLGHFANVLYEIKTHLENRKSERFTEAQMRLIIKRLQGTEGFEDAYWMHYSVQKSIFLDAVSAYTRLSHNFVESFL